MAYELRVSEIEKAGKYLDIPSDCGGSKKLLFSKSSLLHLSIIVHANGHIKYFTTILDGMYFLVAYINLDF